MAGDRELAVIFRAVTTDLVSGIAKAKAEVRGFGDQVGTTFDKVEEKGENVHRMWKSLFEAFIGVEIVNTLKKIAMAADDASTTLETAANSARNFGKALDVNQMEQWLRRFAASAQGGGYAINEMRDATLRFATLGEGTAQIQRALADTANLAAARHISFAEATNIVSAALTGHIPLLARYGIISREAASHIHTVEQAMRALEHATAGAAAIRADKLAGALGRAGNAIGNLTVAFGQGLIPYFTAGANAVDHFAEAIAKLPGWLLKAAGGLTVALAAMTAVGLILPAVRLSVQFLANSFGMLSAAGTLLFGSLNAVTAAAATQKDVLAAVAAGNITTAEAEQLLNATTGTQIGLFGVLRNLLIGPIVAAFGSLMSVVRSATIALGAMVGMEGTAILEFLATVAPVAAVAAALGGLIAAVLMLTHHWNDAINVMGTAWGEFVNGILKSGDTLKMFFAALALMMNPTTTSMGQAAMGAIMAVKMPKTTHALNAGMDWIGSEIQAAIAKIKGFFTFTPGNIDIPKDAFPGIVPGRAGAHHKAKHKKDLLAHLGVDPVALMRDVLTGDNPQLSKTGLEAKLESVRHASAMEAAAQTLTPTKSAAYAVQEARIKQQIALLDKENVSRTLLIDKLLDQMYRSPQLDAEVRKAKEALRVADVALKRATDEAAEAMTKAGKTFDTGGPHSISQVLQNLAQRVPGVGLEGGKLTFNPYAVMLQVLEQTKAFADIMKIVNELMQLFAQIIDAFRPVIDLLLRGIAFVANGFISLWNVMARVLRLFGIHVQLLDKINTDFSNLSQNAAPFIQIVHDIPTLNELASGKISALYPAGTHDSNSLTAPITDGLKDPGLGGGILGALGEILGAILGLKLIMGLFGGGGGGLFGSIGKIFSGKGFAGISAFLGGTEIGGATLGSALLAVAGGALVGNLISKLTGGNTTNSMLGGAIGGGLGATLGMFGLAAGPLGALAGAGLGALIGGLFGPKLNATNNPDIFKTSDWGQGLADYQGSGVERAAMNANGQSFTESSALQQALGGMGEGSFISKWISTVGADAAQKVLGPLATMFTGAAGSIISGKNGMLTLANGVTMYWTDLLAAAQKAITAIGQAGQGIAGALDGVGGNIAGVAGNITRFIDATTNDLAGGTSQIGPIMHPMITAPNAGSSTESATRAGGDSGIGGIEVHVYGDVNGYNDVQKLGQDLALETERAKRMHAWRLDRVAGAPAG